ncbi:MAG: glycosyltransferase, partial [Planctomycetales bacterium]|nr:glycosyltransferase [Planctomycetales bacterium]
MSATNPKRANVLLLTHRVPYPPNRGDRIRSYHLLRFLARRANVHLASLTDEPVTEETQAALDPLCVRRADATVHPWGRWVRGSLSLLRGGSATEGLFHNARLKRTLDDWASDTSFDGVVVFCSSMAQYVPRKLAGVPMVVDLVDVDSEKWFQYASHRRGPKRWLYALEARRVRRLERTLARQSTALTVVSDEEAQLFRSFCSEGHVRGVGNGVDTDYFSPEMMSEHDRSSMGVPARAASGVDDRSMGALARAALRSTAASATSASETPNTSAPVADTNVDCAAEPHEPNCVFVGVLDYYPNIEGITWFCREVWPAVRRAIPEATLSIVGRHPTPRVAELGELPGVTVVGEVPDVRPYLSRAAAAIAPLQIARGVQNKVLEAMSAGTPVIATAEALTGLQAEPDQDALLGVDAGDW